jgi:hypothetical protein
MGRGHWKLLGIAGVTTALWGCGSGLACGENTREEDGFCVADVESSTTGGGGQGGGLAATSVSATSTGTSTSTSTSGAGGGDPVLESLPRCEVVSMDGSIDLTTGCVLGACHGMTYDQINAALDEIGNCEYLIDTTLVCQWNANTIQVFLDDADNDGAPDAGQAAFAIFVGEPFDGGTREGLGPGATLRCFVDVLGNPESMDLEVQDGEYIVTRLEWQSLGVSVSDMFLEGYVDADGRADSIMMYGGF